MRHIKQIDRPYYVWYFKGDQRSSNADSHTSLEFAKQTIEARFAKKAHKGERAEVWLRNRELVFSA